MRKSLSINAMLNAIRQTLAIIFPLITFPYASRVLGSVEYGRYSFSASIISYFILFATFGINNYAIREGARIRDRKAKLEGLVSDLFTISLLTTTFSMILLFVITFTVDNISRYKYLILIQSISIVLSTIGVDWINTIYEDYLYITIRYIIIQIIALVAVFVFVKESYDIAKYCMILVLGSYGGNLVNIIYIRKYVKIRINFKVDFKKYVRPLFLLFINSMATVVYVNSDITMLGFFTNNRLMGIYSFSSKIYNMIKCLINAVLIVTVPRLAYMLGHKKYNYTKLLNTIFIILLLLLVPCTVGLCVLSKPIIFLIGGTQYIDGNLSLKVLSLSLFFALVGSVFTNCILIVNRLEKRCIIGTITSACINVILNCILIPIMGITGAAITTVIAEAINMIIQAFYAYKELHIKLSIDRFVLCIIGIEIMGILVFNHILAMKFSVLNISCSLLRILGVILCSIILLILLITIFGKKIMCSLNVDLLRKN